MAKLPTRHDVGQLPGVPSPGVARIAPAPMNPPQLGNISLPSPSSATANLSQAGALIENSAASARDSTANMFKSVGRDFEVLGLELERQTVKDNALQVTTANSQHALFEIQQMRRYNNREIDAATYQSSVSQNADELSSTLPNHLQEANRARWAANDAGHYSNVDTTEQKRNQDQDTAQLKTALQAYSNIYLDNKSTPRQRTEALENIEDAIEVAKVTHVLTEVQGVDYRNTYVLGNVQQDALNQSENNSIDYARDRNAFQHQLIQKESSGDPSAMNTFGFAGYYQFGAPRAATLGFYTPGSDDDLSTWNATKGKTEKWSGTFNIPGFPQVKTIKDFLASDGAQHAAYDIHKVQMDKEIEDNGLGKYIGKTIGGVEITKDSLYAALHYGGVGSKKDGTGALGFLNGTGDSTDAYGVNRISDYAALGSKAKAGRYALLDPTTAMKTDAIALDNNQFNTLIVELGDGTVGREAVDAARTAGWLKDSGKINQAYAAAEKYKKGNKVGRAEDRLNSNEHWDAFNTEHKAEINAWLEAGEAPNKIAEMDDDYWNEELMPVFNRIGFVPKEVYGPLKSMLRSSSDKDVIWSFSKLDQLDKMNPEAFAGDLDSETMKKLVTYRTLLAYKKPAEIIEQFRLNEDPSTSEARKEALKVGLGLASEVSDDQLLDVFDPGYFSIGPDASPAPLINGAMRAEFNQLFSEAYVNTGNEADATRIATELLGTVWGQTRMGGNRMSPESQMPYVPLVYTAKEIGREYGWAEPLPPIPFEHDNRVMRRPPEHYLPLINGSHEWAKDQLMKQIVPAMNALKATSYVLVADAQTEDEIRQKKLPSYTLTVQDEYGSWDAIPGRIEFDTTEPYKSLRAKGQKDHERAVKIKGALDASGQEAQVKRLGILR